MKRLFAVITLIIAILYSKAYAESGCYEEYQAPDSYSDIPPAQIVCPYDQTVPEDYSTVPFDDTRDPSAAPSDEMQDYSAMPSDDMQDYSAMPLDDIQGDYAAEDFGYEYYDEDMVDLFYHTDITESI